MHEKDKGNVNEPLILHCTVYIYIRYNRRRIVYANELTGVGVTPDEIYASVGHVYYN